MAPVYILRAVIVTLMVLTTHVLAQSATTSSKVTSTCAAATGWSYSSSASASASASGSASSSSSFSVSGICAQAKLPSDCIVAHPHCQWCAQPDFSGQRCNLHRILKKHECNDIQYIESQYTLNAANELKRFNHEFGMARIRIGDSLFIPFRIKEPEVYPVDFYYLMDVSYSMKDDLEAVVTLAQLLVKTLQDLTKGGTGSVKLGFGKFVDKVQSPMTQMTQYKLRHPYGTVTDSPFLFKNVVNLTTDVAHFQEVLRHENVSGNLDPPEGALDAMLQVIQCKDLIGWRGNALRLLMIATESAYHYAADGSGYLAGISKSNDGKCHTGYDGRYVGAEDQDYPTVNQVVRALEEKSITPIFAIGSTYEDLYRHMSEEVFRGSTWGVLARDSSNVVDLVREAYLQIAGKQELVTTNPDADILCPWYQATTPSNVELTFPAHSTLVKDLKSGSEVHYKLWLAANRGACAGFGECHVGNVEVKTRQYDDNLVINTTVLAAFGCAATVDIASAICNGQGDFTCGICICDAGWTGAACAQRTVAIGCVQPGSLDKCSGRGRCLSDQCQCNQGYQHGKSKIYGDFCQCDECPKQAGLLCSGNGIATKVGPESCSCECVCNPDWTGSDCGCSQRNDSCIGLDGLVCSGNGRCECGTCVCTPGSKFGGPTCGDCITDCPSCAEFQNCIQCIMHGSGPYNQTCEINCPKYSVKPVDTNSMSEETIKPENGEVLCAAIDESDNCKFYYSYQVKPGGIEYHAEEDKRCKPAYSLLIILWCILLFLLIGLILLCCWRCCVYVIDKEEAKNYKLSSLAQYTTPAMIPLIPAIGASSVIEFIKAKYLVRRSAKVAVIPVRRSFVKGGSKVLWRTYPGSSQDDDFEVLSQGEEGTMVRKRQTVERLVVQGKNGESTIEVEVVDGGERSAAANAGSGGGGMNGQHQSLASTAKFETVNETAPLLGNGSAGLDWGEGEINFDDENEFTNIEIPLLHDFSGKEISFWVELHGQERGVALGLKRTKVVVIKDEEAGIIGFPKPSYVFKENDGFAVIPIHRTVGMDGHVSVTWFTRDITGISGKHYIGGRGVVEFGDGEVTQHVQVELIPDILYDDSEKAFNVMLDEPKGGASLDLSHCMVTVLGDEECSLVQFPKDAYPFMENCGIAEIAVMRTRSTKGQSQVRWYTEDDTAIAGKDYESSEGIVTFENLATESHIRVPIIDNDVYDDSGRAFRVILTDPSDGTKLAHNTATVSIIEDDEPGMFEFTKTNLVMRSKATLGKLAVIRSLGSDGHITVPWAVGQLGDNNVPPEVLAMNGTLEFANNDISKSLELDLSNVPSSELMNFIVVLQQPTGGAKLGAKSEATVTVFADEDFGTVSFAQSRFEVSATVGLATLLVSRKGDTSSAAFVICETTDQSAVSGIHYRGGTISVLFDADETVKEIEVPIYNDPNHRGQLVFGAQLRSTPSGPKIGNPDTAQVAITCIPMTPVHHAGLAPPGPCTIEFLKSKYLFRRSAKVAVVPVARSSEDGACFVQWRAAGPPPIPDRRSSLSSSSSSSLSSSDDEKHGWQDGVITFQDGQNSTSIELPLDSRSIHDAQVSVYLELTDAEWKESLDDPIRFGLKQTEVVILNDIDAGTLGFSKATFSFKESEGIAIISIHRLGGMDGNVSARWRTVDGTAKNGRDFEGREGVVNFAHNQIVENIEVPLLEGENYGDDGEDRKFSIQIDKLKGGAKPGLRHTTVFIVGDEERSVVQFSKASYPVIGNSTSVKLPVLRTGSFQRRVAIFWKTVPDTAKDGVDYAGGENVLIFEPGETKAFVEIQLSGQAKEPKVFSVELNSDPSQSGYDELAGKTSLGTNKVATVSIISSQEPGRFEFSKTSFIFKTSAELGMVPVLRSDGTDGDISVRWLIESLDKPSPFAGAEGFLSFRDGQVSANIEIALEGVPSDDFVLVLVPSESGAVLGAATRATVTIIGEKEEPTIEMNQDMMNLRDPEVVEVKVLRKGNVEDSTYVGWKTEDGTAINGKNFIGGAGNLVFDPNETEKNILIPVLASPNDEPGTFSVKIVDVRGMGKIGDVSGTEVTLEPVPQTVVEFLRKRYLFRQSQGSSFIPVRRSNANGMLALRWRTQPITGTDESQIKPKSVGEESTDGRFPRSLSSTSSSDEHAVQQKAVQQDMPYDDTLIDWGSGTITFDDGDHEASIELVVCREMAHRESNFRVELVDPYDRVTFAVPTTMVTVIRDKDPGMLGFASPKYNFMCSEGQLVIPVHRSSGADGTVAVPWYTRDVTAVGGIHYLPADGNLIFGDGEVLRKIIVPMPKRVEYFDEDEVAFKLCLGEPTGGASLNVYEAHVVLQNDIVPAKVSFEEPSVTCQQSRGSLQIPVQRSEDASGLVTLAWQVRGIPGKPKSRYEGATGTLVFADGDTCKDITIKLPPHVQQYTMDQFAVVLEQPTSGRATLGEHQQCTASIDNDIIPGKFHLEKHNYYFKQSDGRDVIKVIRDGGTKGAVSLPWRVLPAHETSPPSSMHDLHGSVEFDDGQPTADVTIPFPPDTDEDRESFVFMLLPPEGRGELDEPYRANMNLENDLRCEITFAKCEYEIRGDVDTFLLPVVRDGPKGRPAAVEYKTKDGSAVDCANYIGGEGVLSFEPGENKKDILIPIMNDSNGGRSTFTVELGEITGPAELGANERTTVYIDNVAGAGKFEMASRQQRVNQSDGVLKIVVLRKNGRKGEAQVPWFVEKTLLSPSATAVPTTQQTDDYDNLEGVLNFEEGDDEKELEIPLSTKPQDDDITAIDVTLLTPVSGAGATLGDPISTKVTINNDVDGGTVELENEAIEAFGTDGDVRIVVVRSGSCNHACHVSWEAQDDTAVRGKHYRAGKGMLTFDEGEDSKEIIIPIVNDPSGDVMFFHVALGTVRGGAKLGAICKAQVMIDHVQVHGEIGFADCVMQQKQSNGKIVITMTRKTGKRGRVVVPWSIENAATKSRYNDLHGQETFKDGEEESHIEIETPSKPQDAEIETFSVVLGEPTGGARLAGDTECAVTVINDVIPGKVAFPEKTFEVNQSDEIVKIPVVRTARTEGKIRVPWKSNSGDLESPYHNLSGIETFEDGDDVSHIKVKLPQQPREASEENFVVTLAPPKSSEAVLGYIDTCDVTVKNDIAPALITFDDSQHETLQSERKVLLKIVRTQTTQGRVIVPWKIIPESPDSVYIGVTGEATLEDGDDHGVVDINLPQLPLENPEETVSVALEPPVGAHAKLADDAICTTKIIHDLGEGMIEMRSHDVTCSSEEGEALVAVVRKLGYDFPAEVTWYTEDDDALFGQHYDAEKGKLKFKPGEAERNIHIPLINDPSGESRVFKVHLQDVKGRDKIGDNDCCHVTIDNEATPPNVVGDFDADLVAPQVVHTTWLPADEGAPVEGYKVTYWSRPGTVKTLQLPKDATEADLDDLQPNTSYQVNVRPFNNVGDGLASDTVVVETQPELRLSYQSPVQAKTSQKTSEFVLKRNIKEFKDVVTWKIVKEIRRRRKTASSTSSSQSSSSSSSDSSDASEEPLVVSSGELQYEPGNDVATLQFPLKQDMRHSSQVYRILVRKKPRDGVSEEELERERPLATVELNVVNDTGYPGRVRKPFAASMNPHECTVSWEPPALGGPVEGYKVIAKSDDADDVEETVGPDERKVTLTALKPSTKYRVYVQPFNKIGYAQPSSTAHAITQDEMKVEFSERFYSFKTSDKVAVIPIKRHFTRGYATLHWNVRWCKRSDASDVSSSSSSDSESESEVRGRDWASGSITFQDGVDKAEVRIPLQQATPAPVPRKRSFFWLYVVDPNKKKRLAAMRCKLVDDKARLVAPKNVSIDVSSATSFSVTWEPQEATVHEYLVSYKRAGDADEPRRYTVPANTHSFDVADVQPESVYAVVVSALGDGGQQASSAVISCKTPGKVPGPPNRLAFQVLSPTSLHCSWGEPAVTHGIIVGYEVVYKPTDDSEKQEPPVMIKIPDGHYRSLLVENLLEDTTYMYSVRAQNRAGTGPPRDATMKIEQVGSRPPSAIFLDEENMKAIQEQIALEEAVRKANRSRNVSNVSDDSGTKISTTVRHVHEPSMETKTKTATKTRVTRYIHKDGQTDPEVETVEYDGRLSQEELSKLAENSQRIECGSPLQVQVISYNTSTSSATGPGYSSQTSTTSNPQSEVGYVNPYPQEYMNTDVRKDVSQDTQVFTDVEETTDGDVDVTTITKTYRTTTTERRLETTSGMKSIVLAPDGTSIEQQYGDQQ